jgi:hypothetical protein
VKGGSQWFGHGKTVPPRPSGHPDRDIGDGPVVAPLNEPA